MWEELEKVLKVITGYYEMLYVLNRKKRDVLGTLDFVKLKQIVQKEDEIVGLISKTETKRQQVLMDLAAATEGLSPRMNSRDLYKFMPPEYKSRLAKCHDDLDKIVKKVQELSENNKLLISSALSAVNFHLNRIGGSVVEPTYGNRGQEVVSKEKKFDFKA